MAAIERLRLERVRAAAPVSRTMLRRTSESRAAISTIDSQQELPLGERSSPVDIEAAMADTVRAGWTPPSLDPVTMPEPPKPRLDGPTLGMVARLSGAVGSRRGRWRCS